jgi:hypothetical protein
MGDSRFARCLQGAGVHVQGGTVSIVNSQIYSNRATTVRALLQKFPIAPTGKLLTHLLVLACVTAADASRSTTVGQLCTCRRDLQLYHHPMGDLLMCSPRLTLAQLQAVRAAETMKNSHRPDGKLLTCLPRHTLAQLRPTLRSTAVCTYRTAETCNCPIAPHERLTFCSLFAGRRSLRQ